MCEELRVLHLLLYKNYIVRKRHWFGSIFELIIPVLIIIAILVLRCSYDIEPVHVKDDTYFPILSKADLINDHVGKSLLHLYYKPQNDFTNKLMQNVIQCAEIPHDQLFGFDTEDDMLRSYEIQQGKDELISVLAIDFGDTKYESTKVPEKLIYTIRSSQSIPNTLFDFEGLNLASDKLIAEIPIVPLQMCLDEAYINKTALDGVTKPTVVIQKMPYPPYDNINPSELSIQYVLRIFGGLLFFATIYLIPVYVCTEKTNGVNALLRTNGVKSHANFLSWLASGMLFNIIPIFMVTMLLNLNLYGQKAIYYHSNCSLVWFALFLNITHIYAFCVHAASYFSKAWLAQLMATGGIFMNVVAMQLENTEYFKYVPYLGIFCPPVATTRIFDELNNRENERTGAQWSNVFETMNPALTITGSLGFIMLYSILGILAHFIIAVYLDAVLPSKYGVQKSPLFFLESFTHIWKGNKVCNDSEAGCSTSSDGEPKILECVPDGTLVPYIKLRNLAKSFLCGLFSIRCGNSRKVDAIRGISINFYQGTITALLGHNGAGKTTTFSILTGSMPPSGGNVYINNKDISKDLDEIRSDLGVCPQENTTFPDLTVEEQLRLICSLKQKKKTRKQVVHDVNEMLDKLNIGDKRDVMPDELSGGQKRRLCLGMALIGDASTIFLDEPTSGMDPQTRRWTWDLILKYRNKKTIIITTHSMEEADVLGDRIAIMHSGQMRCYGTSMFLKKHYGHNYHEVTLSTTTWCNERKIREIVGSDAKVNLTHYGRIVISIPFTSSLPEILDNIENQKAELGITGVSVSMITLEQVFLKAAEEEEKSNESIDYVDGTKEPAANGYEYLTGSELTRQRINALLCKKLTYLKSDKSLFIAIILFALLAVLLPALFYSNDSSKTNNLLIDLGSYQSPEVLIYSKSDMLGHTYRKIIENQGGTGTPTQATVSLSNELLSRAVTDLTYYKTRMIISAEFNTSLSANGLYSGSATLSAPLTINVMSNLVLKTVAGDQYSIVASIGDLPRSLKQDAGKKMLVSIRIMITTILFMTLFFHIVAMFAKHPVLENTTKFKQLQNMTGVSAFLYWVTTFLIDYAFYILVTLLTVFGIYLTDIILQLNTICLTEIGILLLLFLLFGINVLLFVYIHTFMKQSFHLVYSALTIVPLLLTIVVVTVSKLLSNVENAENANIIQRRIFSLEPHVSFVFGYMKFAEIAADNARCRGLSHRLNEAACAINDLCCDLKCSDGKCANPLPYLSNFSNEGGLEEFVTYLLLTPIILVCILYLLEQQVFTELRVKYQIKNPKSEDQDKVMDSEVETEKSMVRQAINQRVNNTDNNDENVFLAYELSKSYGKLNAVKEVNFRVKENECFGLLGVNGAGKSTTFRMLVGEEISSSGILHSGPYNIKTNRAEYLAQIGYCPQNDALIPYFNAIEQLYLFARLRGIPNSRVATEVHSWIDKLRLNEYAKNPCGSYSGGNKRRLNIAIALIANPKLVLLDEPTTGVDPAARRLVWTIIQTCQASGQAIVLTSHSMEECEALCNRLAIMARGQLLCVGASQELKERFGAGFNITIKLNPGRSEEDFINIMNKMETAFVCELKDKHPGCLFYHITDTSATWVKMFGTMNRLKSEYDCIEDFTVSTSTLEQLFMQFAKSSVDPPAESHASILYTTRV